MYLRLPNFHLQDAVLAEVYQTLFDDIVIAKPDVETVNHTLYSYEKYVKNTILTVLILRAEITNINGVTEVETLGLCYPRELEQKIIDATKTKDYRTVFEVPNGIEDLKSVEIPNLVLLGNTWAETYQKVFPNEHYYILNSFVVLQDPKVSFAEPEPLTPEQEEEWKQFDHFCARIFPKYEKARDNMLKEVGKRLTHVKTQYGHFRVKRVDIDDTEFPEPSFDLNDYGERLNDHDLFLTFIGDKVTDLTTHDFSRFIQAGLIKVPYYMELTESKVIDPVPITLGMDNELGLDEDLMCRLDRIAEITDNANYLVSEFVKKWSRHPDLTDKLINLLNVFLLSARPMDKLYEFNNEEIVLNHLNEIIGGVLDKQAELQVNTLAPIHLAVDPETWELWDYYDVTNPTQIRDWDLPETLGTHYADNYLATLSAAARMSKNAAIRAYHVSNPVKPEDVDKHAIGSTRYEPVK